MGGYGNATVDGIKVNFWMKTGVFEQILCQVLASPLLTCIIGMDTAFD